MSGSIAPFVPRLLLRVHNRTVWEATGTVAFADISGFTRLSEQLAELGRAGAEELTNILNATFDALLGVAQDEGSSLTAVRRHSYLPQVGTTMRSKTLRKAAFEVA